MDNKLINICIEKKIKFKDMEYKMYYDLVENTVYLNELFGEEKQHIFSVDTDDIVGSIKDTILFFNDIKIDYKKYKELLDWDGNV